ncbi:MAG TPA: phosphodiester glycosidase family protein, partial [Chitinophagales bacterium]|nr:phosphodiester glycosidase family protein [Chitinophagales bacterium]
LDFANQTARALLFLFHVVRFFSVIKYHKSHITFTLCFVQLALTIYTAYYKFELFSAKETKEIQKPADEWAKSKKLTAVINAGMYQADGYTNTGYMKNYDFINNPALNSKYNAVVAFNRKNDSVPEFQIIDLKCQNWDELKAQYHTLIQGIRMIDCNQKNVWSYQEQRWSIAAIGTDKSGNVLFLHASYPYRVHDFINMLLKSSLDIKNAMYLEGGPEASFYLNHLIKIEQVGSYETGFREDDDNYHFWAIPNVIGITKK